MFGLTRTHRERSRRRSPKHAMLTCVNAIVVHAPFDRAAVLLPATSDDPEKQGRRKRGCHCCRPREGRIPVIRVEGSSPLRFPAGAPPHAMFGKGQRRSSEVALSRPYDDPASPPPDHGCDRATSTAAQTRHSLAAGAPRTGERGLAQSGAPLPKTCRAGEAGWSIVVPATGGGAYIPIPNIVPKQINDLPEHASVLDCARLQCFEAEHEFVDPLMLLFHAEGQAITVSKHAPHYRPEHSFLCERMGKTRR